MHLEAGGGVLGGDVGDEVAHAAGVTPLVVVPGDELDEVGAQLDSGVGVEDRGGMAADEVGGDDEFVSVVNDALVLALRGGLDDLLDLIIGSTLLKADNEIDDGDIESGDTEREAPIQRRLVCLAVIFFLAEHIRELSVERGDDLSDGLGGTGRRGDDVGSDGTATTPVLHRRAIDGTLGGGRRVDSGHKTLNDTKVVVDDLCEGSQTVGGAGSV